MILNLDKVASVSIGLVLAILTQLFDLQIRHTHFEERILEANALSQKLYQDDVLLEHIRQIVNDYQIVKTGWFDLFQMRAHVAVIECRNLLRSMAEGHMVADLRGPFTYGDDAVKRAEKSLKAVAAADSTYWRTPHAETYLEANKKAIDGGVKFTRIFVQPYETLRQMVDILEKQQKMKIEVYVAVTEYLPDTLNEDYLIMDDRILMTLRLTSDGHAKGEEISIDPVQVERMVKTFNMTYAKRLDEIIGDLKRPRKRELIT